MKIWNECVVKGYITALKQFRLQQYPFKTADGKWSISYRYTKEADALNSLSTTLNVRMRRIQKEIAQLHDSLPGKQSCVDCKDLPKNSAFRNLTLTFAKFNLQMAFPASLNFSWLEIGEKLLFVRNELIIYNFCSRCWQFHFRLHGRESPRPGEGTDRRPGRHALSEWGLRIRRLLPGRISAQATACHIRHYGWRQGKLAFLPPTFLDHYLIS